MAVQILVGTTSGNTEFLAQELSDHLQRQGIKIAFHDEPKLAEVLLDEPWLICIATHGAGEYADSIAGFMQDLTDQRPDLHQLKFAIVAIGDSSYDTFCQAGVDAETLLTELGAHCLAPRHNIDMMLEQDPEASALEWLKSWDHRLKDGSE